MTAFLKSILSEEDPDNLKKELMEVYRFVELTEAFTTDKRTADRIRLFLIDKGLWKESPLKES